MQKWVAYYEKHNVYPPQVVAQIRAAIDPDGSHKAATAKQADPRQRRQSQPSSAGTVLAHAPPARLDMPQRTVQVPQQFMHNAAMNGTVMPPRPPGGALMPGTMPPAPALGTSFAGIRLQVCVYVWGKSTACADNFVQKLKALSLETADALLLASQLRLLYTDVLSMLVCSTVHRTASVFRDKAENARYHEIHLCQPKQVLVLSVCKINMSSALRRHGIRIWPVCRSTYRLQAALSDPDLGMVYAALEHPSKTRRSPREHPWRSTLGAIADL